MDDLKIPNPEPFKGETKKAKVFLLQLSSRIQAAARLIGNDTAKVALVTLLLHDEAANWALGYQNDDGTGYTWANYTAFVKDFKAQFIDPNLVGSALA